MQLYDVAYKHKNTFQFNTDLKGTKQKLHDLCCLEADRDGGHVRRTVATPIPRRSSVSKGIELAPPPGVHVA